MSDTPKGSRNKYSWSDRFIAVAASSRTHGHLKTLSDLNSKLIDEIEHFFVSSNAAKEKKFKLLGRFGPDRARKRVLKNEL